jgi:hypothetical protein
MISLKNLIEETNKTGQLIVDEIKKVLINNDKKATSKLIDTLSYRVITQQGKISLKIYTEKYLDYIESGRKPGKYLPNYILEDWMKVKNIDLKYLYPINYKIYKFGIEPLPVTEPILRSIRPLIVKNIQEKYKQDINIFVRNELKKLK